MLEILRSRERIISALCLPGGEWVTVASDIRISLTPVESSQGITGPGGGLGVSWRLLGARLASFRRGSTQFPSLVTLMYYE